jgi:hypothetical protein
MTSVATTPEQPLAVIEEKCRQIVESLANLRATRSARHH